VRSAREVRSGNRTWRTYGTYSSRGNELERRECSRRFRKSLHPLQRSPGVVLLAERQSHRVTNTRAADQLAPNGDFEVTDLNRPSSFLLKGTEPAGWLIVPRPHEHSIAYNDDPDTCVTVLGSRANAENLRLAYFFYDCVSELNIIGHHFSSQRHLDFGIGASVLILFVGLLESPT